MLTGLIFATHDAADRPDALAATLPFAGATLIEFQARLLVAAGAAQILIAVARMTPELLGAASRMKRRGLAIDIVRSAAEAAAKVHPLARVIVLADGLVTGEGVLAPFAVEGEGEGTDVLLVSAGDTGLERIDAGHHWAGLARIGASRLGEAARLPRDYDFQATLLRVAAQHGAAKLPLSPAQAVGHGIEYDAAGLDRRGRAVFAALATTRERWVERWVLGPVARLALPPLVRQGASPRLLLIAGGVAGAAAAGLIAMGVVAGGMVLAVLASAVLLTANLLGGLRGDEGDARAAELAAMTAVAAAMLATGAAADRAGDAPLGLVLALALVIAGGLVEQLGRAGVAERWWPAPGSYPVLLLPAAVTGHELPALALLAIYAAAAVARGIERLRSLSAPLTGRD